MENTTPSPNNKMKGKTCNIDLTSVIWMQLIAERDPQKPVDLSELKSARNRSVFPIVHCINNKDITDMANWEPCILVKVRKETWSTILHFKNYWLKTLLVDTSLEFSTKNWKIMVHFCHKNHKNMWFAMGFWTLRDYLPQDIFPQFMSVTCKHNWDVWECSCCMRTQEIWFVIQYLYSYACRGCRGLYPYPYLHSHNHNNFLKCRCSILIRHCHHPPPLLSLPTLHQRCHLTAPGDRPHHVLPSPPKDYNNNNRADDHNGNDSTTTTIMAVVTMCWHRQVAGWQQWTMMMSTSITRGRRGQQRVWQCLGNHNDNDELIMAIICHSKEPHMKNQGSSSLTPAQTMEQENKRNRYTMPRWLLSRLFISCILSS